jgi:hypothetical protein
VSAKKIGVSTYLQYIFIILSALLLLTFVRQAGSFLLTFLLPAILSCVLNLLTQQLKGDVFVPKTMGDPVGVLPLLAFFAVRVTTAALRYLCEPLLFKRMAIVSKVALGGGEQALVEPTVPGEKPAGFRGFVRREV